jgi:hypothetical protein
VRKLVPVLKETTEMEMEQVILKQALKRNGKISVNNDLSSLSGPTLLLGVHNLDKDATIQSGRKTDILYGRIVARQQF